MTTRGRRLASRWGLPSGLLALTVWAAAASGDVHVGGSPGGAARPAPTSSTAAPSVVPSTVPSDAAGLSTDAATEAEGGTLPWRAPAAGSRLPGQPVPTDSAPATAWTPATALPAPTSARGHVDIVFTPHPDDETLSLGVWTANAVARGDRVIVVALTDGRTTGALKPIELRLGHPLTQNDIALARIAEMRAAVADLGVAPADLYLAHLDGAGTPGGSGVPAAEASAVIRAFAARFPDATFATMSWVAERQLDHLSAGRALWQAMQDGTVHQGVFAVSRLWWSLPCPAFSQVLPVSAQVRRRLLAAADAYSVWNPAETRLAVGWTSVRHQFAALVVDPQDKVHGWAPAPAPAKP